MIVSKIVTGCFCFDFSVFRDSDPDGLQERHFCDLLNLHVIWVIFRRDRPSFLLEEMKNRSLFLEVLWGIRLSLQMSRVPLMLEALRMNTVNTSYPYWSTRTV